MRGGYLHIQDTKAPRLTLCGCWTRAVTLLGDEPDDDGRLVCIGCVRRSLFTPAPAESPPPPPREPESPE